VPSAEELRQQLVAELDELTARLQTRAPDYEPPPFSAKRVKASLQELLRKLPTDAVKSSTFERLQSALKQDVFDTEVWRGAWYMLNYTMQYNADLVKRRFTGDYETDEWGLDWEFVDAVRPLLTFLYKAYWRVQTTGIDRIPHDGRALLVANRSGPLPWDGLMVNAALLTEHPAQRLVRVLHESWYPTLPFLSTWMVRMGQALASTENGTRLLEQEDLVAVFPESHQGAGKLYKDRYQLARFGQADFVQMALRTKAPVIPVSVVGAEETYVSIGRSPTLAKITGAPYFPVTPTFPWLGLLGLVPLPTKWYIDFGEAMPMNGWGPDAAENLVLVSQLADKVRHAIQDMILDRLAQRKSVFLG
jgi:1-acyl-sn-glycerol-3-phosphate acyltransferase